MSAQLSYLSSNHLANHSWGSACFTMETCDIISNICRWSNHIYASPHFLLKRHSNYMPKRHSNCISCGLIVECSLACGTRCSTLKRHTCAQGQWMPRVKLPVEREEMSQNVVCGSCYIQGMMHPRGRKNEGEYHKWGRVRLGNFVSDEKQYTLI